MSLKKAISYEIYTCKKSLYIFYFVIICLYALISILSKLTNVNGNIGGMESSSMIFIFILGLNSFKPNFFMTLQNGISRKTLMISNVISLGVIAGLMTLIDTVFLLIVDLFTNNQTMFDQIYGYIKYADSSKLEVTLHSIVWSFFLYFFAAMIGLFITTAYYRMNKALKTAVSVGVPVFFIILLPIIDEILPELGLTQKLMKAIAFCLGLLNGRYPYTAVLSFFIGSVIITALSYLLTRKAVVK